MVAVGTGLVVMVVLGFLARVAITMSRHSLWAMIVREAPEGSTLAGFEPDSRTLVRIGRGVANPQEGRGER